MPTTIYPETHTFCHYKTIIYLAGMGATLDMIHAEADLNATALSDYLTKYPERAVGNTFTDTVNGWDWVVKLLTARQGYPVLMAKFKDTVDGEIEYIREISNINLQKALYHYIGDFTITGTTTNYNIPDAKGGIMDFVSIDGGAALVQDTDYAFDSATGDIDFLIIVTDGQQVDYIYKKNPYSD